jgi:hypothetical protein
MNRGNYKNFYGRRPGLFFIWLILLSLLIAQALHWLEKF